MLDFISRVIMLPMLFGALAGVLIIPLFPFVLLADPSLEAFWIMLFTLGLYPLLLSYLHGAIFIEHFITRSISKRFVDDSDMLPDSRYLNLSIWAGAYLSEALRQFRSALDGDTLRRGQTVLERHQAINRFIWPGIGVSVLAGIGMFLLKEFGLT